MSIFNKSDRKESSSKLNSDIFKVKDIINKTTINDNISSQNQIKFKIEQSNLNFQFQKEPLRPNFVVNNSRLGSKKTSISQTPNIVFSPKNSVQISKMEVSQILQQKPHRYQSPREIQEIRKQLDEQIKEKQQKLKQLIQKTLRKNSNEKTIQYKPFSGQKDKSFLGKLNQSNLTRTQHIVDPNRIQNSSEKQKSLRISPRRQSQSPNQKQIFANKNHHFVKSAKYTKQFLNLSQLKPIQQLKINSILSFSNEDSQEISKIDILSPLSQSRESSSLNSSRFVYQQDQKNQHNIISLKELDKNYITSKNDERRLSESYKNIPKLTYDQQAINNQSKVKQAVQMRQNSNSFEREKRLTPSKERLLNNLKTTINFYCDEEQNKSQQINFDSKRDSFPINQNISLNNKNQVFYYQLRRQSENQYESLRCDTGKLKPK